MMTPAKEKEVLDVVVEALPDGRVRATCYGFVAICSTEARAIELAVDLCTTGRRFTPSTLIPHVPARLRALG